MSKGIVLVFSLVGLFSVCVGQVIFPDPQPGVPVVFSGQCDENIAAVPNFNMNDFQGTWHEIAGYPEANKDGQCISQEFTVNATNSMRLDSFSVLDLTQSTTEGHVTFASDDDLSGKLKINIWVNGEAQSIPYWILSTDYTDYALVYSCVNIDGQYRGVWSWKLSRTRQLSDEGTAAINDAIATVDVLRNDYYENIQQTDTACFYLPDITPGDNVVLPGQCDSSIGGMPNFDISRYAGEWRLIEAYGSRYYSGACNVARYTLQASDILSITNSQVVNEQLASISGTATISSTDGSGQLTFNLINREYVQYILDTDYDSFALAYGCANSGDNQRRITSWKLSRSNTLSQDANNRINQIINDIEFLHQPYYYQVDRSSDGCFYFPAAQAGVPVVFRRQCDENIAAVPNFNMNDFQGTWHEIAGYPEANQNGQCISQEFTVNATNSMRLDSFSVLDLTQLTTEGHVTFASDDDLSGKLKINIWVNGEAQSIPYWILSTDYTDYALVYSCVNIDEENSAVWSWKLSRTRQLSDEGTAAIDDAIATVDVLRNDYYENIQQTDTACFHLPDITPGDNVVLPGQCDSSIGGMPNFDISRYAGEWRLIEAYGSRYYSGACNVARYTLQASDILSITNSQVVNEQLASISGTATISSTDGSGQLTFNLINREYVQYILDTDYDSFALAYGCANSGDNQRRITSWKLSRSNTLSQDANNRINQIINDIEFLHQPYYYQVDRSSDGCFYFPVAQAGVPVVFRRQCDENIAAVPNFNMNDFQGTWHEIAGYPEANQNGQCISQEFTVNATNSMRLDSFSVLDLTQSTTEGHVTFANDDDLSGKLKINIWVNGEAQSIPYWILSTDYTDYALVYSCVNIDEENSAVWSWKLSRTRQLSDEGTAAIDDAIATVDVLRNDYYENIQQTDTACFHLPDITPGDNVVLPGQCDSSIGGMPNFDISRYAGEWRLIEAYGSRYYSGACNVARYTLQASDILSITNSQVVNEQLASISGTATISSTDGSGQLTFNLINREYVQYILDTDYDSFALAYGCANSGDNQRRITSWKLSRSNTLSQEASSRINQIINDIEFLHQPYYYQVDRSSDGCFYFPAAQAGVPVVFRGQCDENIAATPNFNMNEFQGTWHEIAGYPEANKDGQCISQEFTVNATNSMHLDSFSVLDLTQSTTEGHVTFASDNDLSGKLEINVWVNGEAQSIPYWILSTDYTDYALVYSCVNIDEEYSAVGSWKLSRNLELSEDANSVINDVISTIHVLREEYYQDTSQTDQACFHYPTQTGARVILPGQCDINITAVESFDVARFAINSWYLIKRYDAVGDCSCIGTRLSFNEQTRDIEILSFEVVNENLLTTEGSGQLSSNDGNGIFSLVMGGSGDGERTETTIYILATDYDGYALAYSCENINSNQRQVGAWQLSRGRTMSEAGNAAITDIIEERPELYEPYFKPISQDEECLEPSSAFLFKSSITLIFVCTVLQLLW